MEKMENAANVSLTENVASMEALQVRKVDSVLFLYVKDTKKPLELELTEMQTFVAVHSIMKKDKAGNVTLFSREVLNRSRDMKKPLNHNLYSIEQMNEMLQSARICNAFLDFYPGKKEAEPLWLENSIIVAVILARLGINIETGSGVSDEVLEIIYGSEWDSELVMNSSARPLVTLPYTRINPKAGIQRPKQIKKLLDKTLIGQDEVKEKMATAVYEQELAVRYNTLHVNDKNFIPLKRQNVLLYGTVGSGKTALLKKLGEVTERPVVSYDVATLVPSGMQGNKVIETVYELIRQSDGDMKKAARGIICLDNWDELFCNDDNDVSVHMAALHDELLQLMNGRKVTFRDNDGDHKLDTSNILFIIGGRFSGLDEIAAERVTGKKSSADNWEHRQAIGFIRDVEEKPNALVDTVDIPSATLSDLNNIGMSTDVLENITAVCRMKTPDSNDLVNILTHSDASPIRRYEKVLRLHNVALKVSKKALKAAADKALEQKMGACGLATVFENVLDPVIYQIAGNRKRMTLHLSPECFTEGVAPKLVPQKVG